jgi:hypothetical protein
MKRTAFATTAALMLMVVVSAALLTLGGLMRADGNRTIAESQDAQLRQIAHAAAVEAKAKLAAGGEVPASWEVVLPASTGATAHVELQRRRATISAQVHDRLLVEIIDIP